MSEKLDAPDQYFEFDPVDAYNEGYYTRWELFAEVLRHLNDENIGRTIDALPADLRAGFVDWAKERYDNDIELSEMFSLGGEGCRETPDEAIFAIRRWFALHRDDKA